MSKPRPRQVRASADSKLSDAAALVAELAEQATHAAVEDVSERAVQETLRAGVKLYLAKREAGSDFPPFPNGAISATEALVVVTALTKAVDLELFEVALWSNWGDIVPTKWSPSEDEG